MVLHVDDDDDVDVVVDDKTFVESEIEFIHFSEEIEEYDEMVSEVLKNNPIH
jgi:hypothetical protein